MRTPLVPALVLAVAVCAYACARAGSTDPASLASMVYSLPPWTTSGILTDEERLQFESVAKIFQKSKERDVIEALEIFSKRYGGCTESMYEEDSKPYLLMRFIFAVPPSVVSDTCFKGWRGNQGRPMLWPLEWNSDEILNVAEGYKGSNGLPYSPSAEYKYFKRKFPFFVFK